MRSQWSVVGAPSKSFHLKYEILWLALSKIKCHACYINIIEAKTVSLKFIYVIVSLQFVGAYYKKNHGRNGFNKLFKRFLKM